MLVLTAPVNFNCGSSCVVAGQKQQDHKAQYLHQPGYFQLFLGCGMYDMLKSIAERKVLDKAGIFLIMVLA